MLIQVTGRFRSVGLEFPVERSGGPTERLLPPFIISEQDVDKATRILDKVLCEGRQICMETGMANEQTDPPVAPSARGRGAAG